MLFLDERQKKLTSLDVIAAEKEEDRRLHTTLLQNTKMAIGLAGAVIMAACADEQTASALAETCTTLSSFCKLVTDSRCSDEDVTTLAADARKLASLFEKEQPPAVAEPDISKKDSKVNVVDSIRERLAEDSPVERGGALLDAGRLIRLRSPSVLLQLEEWLFVAMKDALFDSDSYVYLAAINGLAEASCYSSKYLREMISLFKNFEIPSTSSDSQVKDKEEDDVAVEEDPIRVDVVVRSRLCEAIGKVKDKEEDDVAVEEDPVRVDVVVRSRLCEAIGKVFRELEGVFAVHFQEKLVLKVT
ncbi:unnamed protein product [Strongylus vulgaris]|uniref:RNA polymerase II assembly factor Rtp1 C-terminal domain-containing protein n=1 Tax=Strongylus vulgaris TaxID=40348 RepID=A0A3P7JV09_STRVU|nr:unnamed protein product [Strongylus vulgaris]